MGGGADKHPIRWGRWVARAGVAAALGGATWLPPTLPLLRTPRPAQDVAEALARAAAWDAASSQPLLEVCHTRVLPQPARARRVAVLFHGYTNCPHQFQALAPRLHAAGYAVVAMRLPYHGQVNRHPVDLHRMTAPRVAEAIAEALDLAHPLGERLTVIGFSFGGVMAGWAAQQRGEVEHAVLIAPALGLLKVSPWARRPFARLAPYLPRHWHWWDPVRREQKIGPPHSYWGYPTQGAAVILRCGEGVLAAARHQSPQGQRLTVVVNAADTVVDNRPAQALAEVWQKHGRAAHVHTFPAEEQLMHDLMDPLQPNQPIARTYPVLEALIGPAE
jgi:pimeloyl-ACP methyl ester carboxylesterase